MAIIPSVPAIPGTPSVKDVWALLKTIQDPESMAARLQQLVDFEAKLEAQRAAIGISGDIDRLLIQAQADRRMAAETLAQAKADADGIRADAQATRDEVRSWVAQQQQSVAEDRQAINTEKVAIANAERRVAAQEAAFQSREAALAAQVEEAKRQMAQAQAVHAEFTARLEKLKAAAQAAAGE